MDSEARTQLRKILIDALDIESCRHHDLLDVACARCLADAVLDLGEVAVEARLTVENPPIVGDWLPVPPYEPENALKVLPDNWTGGRFQRRLLLITELEPVPTQKENTPDGQ